MEGVVGSKGKSNLENGEGDKGPRSGSVRSHPCRFCSASFSSEIELILHFHQEHFPRKKSKRRKLSSLPNSTVSVHDDSDNDEEDVAEFESELDSESSCDSSDEEETESSEDEGTAAVDFLTDCEEMRLQNPVLQTVNSSSPCAKGQQTLRSRLPKKNTQNLSIPSQQKEVAKVKLNRRNNEGRSKPKPGNKQAKNGEREAKHLDCIFCEKSYSRRDLFNAHLRGEHTKEAPYFCKLCESCFSRAANLATHMQRHHGGATPYKCPSCSDSFSAKSRLVKHMQTHLNERKFECVHCKMRFSNKSGLTRHLISHATEKPHTCVTCGKGFTRPSRLQYHVKRFHSPSTSNESGGKVTCSVCDREFKWNCLLEEHMTSHTNEKRFECEHCGKRYARKRDKDRHVRKEHIGKGAGPGQ